MESPIRTQWTSEHCAPSTKSEVKHTLRVVRTHAGYRYPLSSAEIQTIVPCSSSYVQTNVVENEKLAELNTNSDLVEGNYKLRLNQTNGRVSKWDSCFLFNTSK